ncbi:MAG: L,D-transpeptidase family protein [Rhodobacteraceae bacterium]|nr:L,D-transpeptidase family protein [Paracoccaceae bacterium]
MVLLISGLAPAQAQVTAFKQAVAEAASDDPDVAAFYRLNGYQPIWTGAGTADLERRRALIEALAASENHGLPRERYAPDALLARMRDARTTRDLGLLEVEISQVFLAYARDVQTGMITPSRIDKGIVRDVPYRDRAAYLVEFADAAPGQFLRALPPSTREYTGLMVQRLKLERLLAQGGWGPAVPARKLEPGDSGPAVIALRDRLVAMGYLPRSAVRTYDSGVEQAVRRFQAAHGLEPDGVAGAATVAEINIGVAERLKSVHVAMERERWMNRDRGARHVLVNLTDFTARIVDHDRVTFETRSVIGHRDLDRRTPEFSDVMEHMVINPSWYVPRSIITKEYLPKLRANPNAVSHLEITDSRGRVVNRGAVNFAAYSARSFPYSMRQPPSNRNALGLVKFMFPNKHNIYLHDTPAKNLFQREVRAYSHGCIRLSQPFEFAYALLARQSDDPEEAFHSVLRTGRETRVDLEQPVPVHLIYRTAFTSAKGDLEFRRDIYGRDAKIWEALRQQGVALRGVQG